MYENNNNDKMQQIYHWKQKTGAVLWVVSLLALIAAWIASNSEFGLVWGRDEIHWYLDALVLGVLALGCKMHRGKGDCGKCDSRGCGVSSGNSMN